MPATREPRPWIFFLLVFLLSIPLLVWGGAPLPIPIKLPVSALNLVVPTVAAGMLCFWQGGWGAVKALFARVFDFRRAENKAWFAVTLLIFPAIFLLAYLIMRVTGRPLPADQQVPWRMAPVLLIVFFIAAAFEELGWSGYATDPLQKRWGALAAAVIIGMIWQAWHLIPDLQNAQPASWIFWHRLGGVALRVLIVWLYNNTGKSVFAAILAHDMVNESTYLFPNYGSHYDPLVTGILLILAAVGVVIRWGPRALRRGSGM